MEKTVFRNAHVASQDPLIGNQADLDILIEGNRIADPDSGVGFGYCLNRFGGNPLSDRRIVALYDSLLKCVI